MSRYEPFESAPERIERLKKALAAAEGAGNTSLAQKLARTLDAVIRKDQSKAV